MPESYLRITVRGPGDAAEPHVLLLGATRVVVGRSRDAGVRLPSADVSGAHARLAVGPAGVTLEDLGSVNGTRLAGDRLLPGEPRAVAPGDPIEIGDYTLTVELSALPPPAHALRGEDGTATLAAHLVRDLLGGAAAAASQARLEITAPAGAARVIQLVPGAPLKLGRDPRCAVALEDPELSREHAELQVALEHVTLRDLQSKNGVTVNGERLLAPRRLHHGDVLGLGPLRARFADPAEALLLELAADQEPAASPAAPDPGAAPSGDLHAGRRGDGATHAPTRVPARARSAGRSPGASVRAGQLTRGILIAVLLGVMIAATAALWVLFR